MGADMRLGVVEAFNRLTDEERARVLELVEEALRWRGNGGLGSLAVSRRLDEIAGILERHGFVPWEYT